MKRRHLLLVALSLIITVCMCLSLAGCGKKSKATQLDAPVVTISDEGVAQWEAVEHASGYAYKVDNGDETATDKTSVTLTEGQSIVVKAVGDGKNYSDSGWSQAKTYSKPSPSTPKTLSTPVVLIGADGTASWSKITGALLYVYKINGGEEHETTSLSVKLNDGEAIVVKAVGDGTTYYDSAWSAEKIYNAQSFEPVQLDKPVVSVNEDGLASWAKITGATSYAYIVNGTEQKMTSNLYVQLENVGDKIKVQALGDPNYYTESEWSEEVEYVKNTVQPDEPQTLPAPVLSVDENGVATWTEVPHATAYAFLKNGTEGETSARKLELEPGDTLKVKALGDEEHYLDSDWSNEVTYTTGSTNPPEPEYTTHAQYMAAEKGDKVKVKGVVTGIAGKNIYFQDSDGGYYLYNLSSVPADLAIGKTIIVDGEVDIMSSGLREIKNATAEVTSDATVTVTATDITDLVASAEALNDDALLATQGMLVTIKGVTLDSVDSSKGYYYFTIGNHKITLYISGTQCIDTDAQTTLKALFAANLESKADITGFVSVYNNFQLVPSDENTLVVKGAVALGAPVVSIDYDGLASWVADPNAVGYVVEIDGVEKPQQTATTYTLISGQKIRVKAIGDHENYNDSAWSEEKTYEALVAIPSVKAGSLSFATTANRVTQNANSQVWQQNGIKFTNDKAASSSDVTNSSNPVRCYASSSIKVEYTDMVKIVFNCNSESYATALYNSIDKENYFVSVDGKVVTVELCAKLNSFEVAKLTAQVRIDSIDVYVAKVAQALGVPALGEIDEYGYVTWNTVDNAIGYEYSINDGNPVKVDAPVSVKLENGQSIKVRAVGDGNEYVEHGDWSEAKTYTKQVQNLTDLPAVDVDEITGEVTLAEGVNHATKYVYQTKAKDSEDWSAEVEIDVKDIDAYPYTVLESLNDGDSIRIRAVGDEIYVFPADEWTVKTYTAPVDPVALHKPTVKVASNGKVTWSHTNEHVTEFKYYIDDDLTDDDLNEVQWLTPDGDVVLDSGKSIAVKACSYNEMTLDSKATIVTYKAPDKFDEPTDVSFSIEEEQLIISWTAPKNAVEGITYTLLLDEEVYSSNITTTEVTVDLDDYIYIQIKANGNIGEPVNGGDYSKYFSDSELVDVAEDFEAYYDQYKVNTEKNALTLPANVVDSIEIPLPENGTTYTSVAMLWDIEEGDEYAEITEDNKLKIDISKVPSVGTTVKVYVYLSLNDADAEATFDIFVKALTEVSFSFVGAYDNNTVVSTESKDGVTLTFGQGTHISSKPTYFSDGTAIRLYAGNTLTVSANKSIKKIVFTTSVECLFVATASTGAFVDLSTWKGEAAEIVFNALVFAGQNHSRISTITVYFGTASDEDNAEIAIALLPDLEEQYIEDFELDTVFNGLTVTWTAVAEEVEGAGSITFEGGKATVVRGEVDTTVTVTASVPYGDGLYKTKEFTVKVPKKLAEGEQDEVKLYAFPTSSTIPTGSNNAFAKDCDVEVASEGTTVSSATWNVEGNSQMQPWRFGGNKITGTERKLTGKTAITGQVTKVLATFTDSGSITVNSITFNVYNVNPTSSGATALYNQSTTYTKEEQVTFTPKSGENWSDCYYQIVFNLTVSGTSNKYVSISDLQFYGYKEGNSSGGGTTDPNPGGGDEPTDPTVDTIYTLTQKAGESSTLDGACDVTLDNSSVWNVEGNASVTPWQFGGKGITEQERKLTGKTAISGQVTKVLLSIVNDGSITINSITLNVYNEVPGSDVSAVATKSASYTNDEITFTADPEENWSNCYYQIVFTLTTNSDNGNSYITISSLVFLGHADGDSGNTDPKEGTWTLVTDISQLANGAKIIIADASGNKALSTDYGSASITVSNNTATITDSVLQITLKKGDSDNEYYFMNGDQYIVSTAAKKNLSASSSGLIWTITVSGSSTTIQSTHGILQNNGDLFRPYASATQTAVVIYVYSE